MNQRADKNLSALAPGLAHFNLRLFLGSLLFAAIAFVGLRWHDPEGPLTFMRPPHERYFALGAEIKALKGCEPGSAEFESTLDKIVGNQETAAWFVYDDGRVLTNREAPAPTIPDPARKGKETRLAEMGRTTSFSPVPSGIVIVQVDLPPPFLAENGLLLSFALALLATVPLVLLTTFLRARKLEKPLSKLESGLRSLDAERLDHRLSSGDEITDLSASFNEMAERLEEALQELKSQKEKAEKADKSRRDLLADVSHNLGTPLAAMQGWVGYLEDEMVTEPAERKKLYLKLSRELRHVSRMVLQLLELSRWEHSEPRLLLTDFPLLESLIEVAESLEAEASEWNVALRFEGLHQKLLVRADRSRVRELLQIFLENAIRHGGGGIEVVVSTREHPGRVSISVSDNGVGIEPGRLPHIKERFLSSSGNGSGLGMAIADRLVRSHGGSLEVVSEVGRGTTVTFELETPGSTDEPKA